MDWTAFQLSLSLALSTLLVLLPLGVWLARWLARRKGAIKPWIEAAVTLPLVLPPTVLGFYLLLAFSPDSGFGRFVESAFGVQLSFQFSGLLIASLIFNLPFMVQPVQQAFEAIPKNLIEAAHVSGLNRLQTFMQVELPLAWPGIVTACVLTFVHTLGEFGVVLMIGGSIPGETRTLAIAIYDSVQVYDLSAAASMSLTLMAFSILAVALTFALSRRRRAPA